MHPPSPPPIPMFEIRIAYAHKYNAKYDAHVNAHGRLTYRSTQHALYAIFDVTQKGKQ